MNATAERPSQATGPARMSAPARPSVILVDRLALGVLMLVYVASAVSGGSGYDTARDVAQAFAIRHHEAYPLHGPLLAGTVHLGPVWFYLLALPLWLHESWLGVALFATALGSLQFPLAYAAGRRLLDRRFGLLWAAMLALPGWGSFELLGFGHANLVRAWTMLVLYALVRLGQERRPVWLVAAAAALSLAIHAHPSTAGLAFVVAAVAVSALRKPGALLRWGALSLVVAALPLAPLALEQASAPTGLLAHTGALVDATMQVRNLAHLPGLLHGLLWRGPRVIADAFFAASPALPGAVQAIILALEVAAAIGVLAALRTHRRLVLVALGACLAVIVTVAWMRPVTPYWMAYATLPLLAGLGALGLHSLCALAARPASAWGALIVILLALHAGTVGAIAWTMASGEVSMAVAPRIDVKQDDPGPAPLEPWFPAYAVDASGEMLCGSAQPLVLHGTYAYLADSYFGLDHRLHCGRRDMTQLGREPAGAMHLVGLAQPLWVALGWRAPRRLGGLGVGTAARVVHPDRGYPIPDGNVYPPYAWPTGPMRAAVLEFAAPRDEAVAISTPHYIWMPKPTLKVSANGVPQVPLGSDAISAVYACRACAAAAAVAWRVEMDSAAPEWVDVVTLAAPDRS